MLPLVRGILISAEAFGSKGLERRTFLFPTLTITSITVNVSRSLVIVSVVARLGCAEVSVAVMINTATIKKREGKRPISAVPETSHAFTLQPN